MKPVGWGQRRSLHCPPEALGAARGQRTLNRPVRGDRRGSDGCSLGSVCLEDRMASTPCAPLPSVPFSLSLSPSPFLFPFLPLSPRITCPLAPIFPSFTCKILSLHSFSPCLYLSHTSASLFETSEILPSQGKEEAHPPQNTRNRTSARIGVNHVVLPREKAIDDNTAKLPMPHNHSHSATAPSGWRQQN